MEENRKIQASAGGSFRTLIIHDLNTEDELNRIIPDRDGMRVISDDCTIHPCVGCFGCWNRDPGRCVIKDGYENMGFLIHHAEEVRVISRYTYGGFSSFVKNVFDRSLGYVLPHFEIVEGEMHHRKRYAEDKPFTFYFYGDNIGSEEKETAKRYVKAVCTNIRGTVKEVVFLDSESETKKEPLLPMDRDEKVAMLNCSMRKKNSYKLALELEKKLGKETVLLNLSEFHNNHPGLAKDLEEVSDIVLCTPLYVDGLPSQLIRFLEFWGKEYHGSSKRIYCLANMGLYESQQLKNLLSQVRQWTTAMDFSYCGSLAVGAGELVGAFLDMGRIDLRPLTGINKAMEELAEAIGKGETAEDIYSGPTHFPRSLYLVIANSGWSRQGKKNGLRKEDLFRKL